MWFPEPWRSFSLWVFELGNTYNTLKKEEGKKVKNASLILKLPASCLHLELLFLSGNMYICLLGFTVYKILIVLKHCMSYKQVLIFLF